VILNTAHGGRRSTDVDCSWEILGSESHGSVDVCRGFSSHRIIASFSPMFPNWCVSPLFFLLQLQPRGMERAKLLVIN